MCRAMWTTRFHGSGPSLPQRLRQVLALEVLHHEEHAAVGGASEVGDPDDVVVVDPRGRPGLEDEALLGDGVAAVLRRA